MAERLRRTTFDQFQNKADNMDAQGYLCANIFGYMSYNTPSFSGVWGEDRAITTIAWPTAQRPQDPDNGYPNFRLARLSTYQDSGVWR